MALVALGIVLTPGPNMIYLVSRSISQGRVAGLISLTDTVAGFGVYMTLANLGLGVFLTMRGLYDTVRLAGAAQVTVSAAVNATIILAAAVIAARLATRPAWLRWQRRVTGILLAAVAVTLALGT
jgi:threonine/homoserine/homoserine lactone efflux protein